MALWSNEISKIPKFSIYPPTLKLNSLRDRPTGKEQKVKILSISIIEGATEFGISI